eukprot:2116931-Rhodomonas_salina.5
MMTVGKLSRRETARSEVQGGSSGVAFSYPPIPFCCIVCLSSYTFATLRSNVFPIVLRISNVVSLGFCFSRPGLVAGIGKWVWAFRIGIDKGVWASRI